MIRPYCLVAGAVIAMGFAGVGGARAQSAREFLERGDRLYAAHRYEDALAAYREGVLKHPEAPELHQGAGSTLYRLKRFDEAAREFEQVGRSPDPALRSAGQYNWGNSSVRSNKLEESLEKYREALRNHPEDRDAKFNYELIQGRLQQQQQQKNEQKNPQQNQKDPRPKDDGKKPQQEPQSGGDQHRRGDIKDSQQLTREQAEQLLKALDADEQRLQRERMRSRVSERKPGKDW